MFRDRRDPLDDERPAALDCRDPAVPDHAVFTHSPAPSAGRPGRSYATAWVVAMSRITAS